MMQLDPGMGYTAGEYFTMMPLAAEKYDTGTLFDEHGIHYLLKCSHLKMKVQSELFSKCSSPRLFTYSWISAKHR